MRNGEAIGDGIVSRIGNLTDQGVLGNKEQPGFWGGGPLIGIRDPGRIGGSGAVGTASKSFGRLSLGRGGVAYLKVKRAVRAKASGTKLIFGMMSSSGFQSRERLRGAF